MDGWMDGWMVGWMDGWMDGWVDGWMDAKVKPHLLEWAITGCSLLTRGHAQNSREHRWESDL